MFMEEEYKLKEYLNFLDEFSMSFEEKIDELVKSGQLEDEKYQSIFEIYSDNNKKIFNDLIDKLFNFDIDFSKIQSKLDSGTISKNSFDKYLNRKMLDVITRKRVFYEKTDDMYFYESKFMNVLDYLTDFCRNNYFTLENEHIRTRDLRVAPSDCREMATSICPRLINYDAIMDKNGETYMAIGYHDLLIEYLLANSIDMREAVRISHNESSGIGFDLSSLYAFYDYYASPEDMQKDRFVYLDKKRIRNLCKYMKSAMPHLSKSYLYDIFKYADGFGYDFTSSSNENNTDRNYDIAMENLRNVMSVLDELYPEQPPVDLVKIYSDRLRELNHNIF